MGREPSVSAFMGSLVHPRKAEIEALRRIIRAAEPRLEERIKWNAPSYHLGGTDFAAFNLRQQEFVQLILLFPHGLVDDPGGMLQGSWKDRREVRFADMDDVESDQTALATVIRAWAVRHDAANA